MTNYGMGLGDPRNQHGAHTGGRENWKEASRNELGQLSRVEVGKGKDRAIAVKSGKSKTSPGQGHGGGPGSLN